MLPVRLNRGLSSIALAATVGLVLGANAAHAEYWPPRPIYDYEKEPKAGTSCADPQNLGADHSRCGPIDGPVFNSFINTPSVGDERAFFDGRRTDESTHQYANIVYGVATGARRVVLHMYVNNNANEAWGARTTATGTRVRVALPQNTGDALRAVAYVTAENATPPVIEDTIDLVDSDRFRVRYVRGSARMLRDATSTPVSDMIVSSEGAPIGSGGQLGHFEAGFDKAVLVELQVDIEPRSRTGLWVALGLLTVLVLAVGLWDASRARLVASGHLLWTTFRRGTFWEQILAGVVGAGLTAVTIVVVRFIADLAN